MLSRGSWRVHHWLLDIQTYRVYKRNKVFFFFFINRSLISKYKTRKTNRKLRLKYMYIPHSSVRRIGGTESWNPLLFSCNSTFFCIPTEWVQIFYVRTYINKTFASHSICVFHGFSEIVQELDSNVTGNRDFWLKFKRYKWKKKKIPPLNR